MTGNHPFGFFVYMTRLFQRYHTFQNQRLILQEVPSWFILKHFKNLFDTLNIMNFQGLKTYSSVNFVIISLKYFTCQNWEFVLFIC